ncbi:MAG TPA: hypothetical protein VMT03_04645 [Polyangia bacterium]|nr:hypothetical protein [Polyangia bacterium]
MSALRAAVVSWVTVAAVAGCAVPMASALDDARMKRYVPAPDRAPGPHFRVSHAENVSTCCGRPRRAG